MNTGDKFSAKRWKSYYDIDIETNNFAIPQHGLFPTGTVVGTLVDMDRGVISFFKDGKDLGEAFVSPDIKEGEFFPLIHTQIQCMVSVFHPSVFPWFEKYDNPVPIPPEPPIDLYSEQSEYDVIS